MGGKKAKGAKKAAKGAKKVGRQRGGMMMAAGDGVGMTPAGLKGRGRRARHQIEQRLEARKQAAEDAAEQRKKEQEEARKRTQSTKSLSQRELPKRFQKKAKDEDDDEPTPSGLPAEEKLEILLYFWKNFFWNK